MSKIIKTVKMSVIQVDKYNRSTAAPIVNAWLKGAKYMEDCGMVFKSINARVTDELITPLNSTYYLGRDEL